MIQHISDRWSIDLTLAQGDSFKKMTSLKISIYENDNLIATNTAKAKIFDEVNGYGYRENITIPFYKDNNKTSSSWNLGNVGKGTPNKVTIKFIMDGTTYFAESTDIFDEVIFD